MSVVVTILLLSMLLFQYQNQSNNNLENNGVGISLIALVGSRNYKTDVFTHFKAHLLLSMHGTLISVNLTDVSACVNSK